MDSYAEAKFNRKCTFSEALTGQTYTVVRATSSHFKNNEFGVEFETASRHDATDRFEKMEVPQAGIVRSMAREYSTYSLLGLITIPGSRGPHSLSLKITRADFYKIFDQNLFSRALLGLLADGHLGFQWIDQGEGRSFYLGTPSCAVIWCERDNGAHKAIYLDFSAFQSSYGFLHALHQHHGSIIAKLLPAYCGVLVEWEELRRIIDLYPPDIRAWFLANNSVASSKDTVGHQVDLTQCLERLQCLGDTLASLKEFSISDDILQGRIRLLQDQVHHERRRLTSKREQYGLLSTLVSSS